MKKHFAIILSAALVLSMTACGEAANGNTNNEIGEISAGLEEIGEKVGDLLGIKSKEEKVLENSLFKEGLLAVKVDGKWGYIDENGNFAIELQFESAENFQSNGLAVVSSKVVDSDGYTRELYGLIDKNGNYLVEPRYWEINLFQPNGLAVVTEEIYENGKPQRSIGIIDEKGNYVVEPTYKSIENFQSNGLAVVSKTVHENGKSYTMFGAIDEKGNYVIYPIYDKIGEFDENGIAKIAVNERIGKVYDYDLGLWCDTYVYDWGLINEKGEVILEPKHNEIGDFYCGWATVSDMPANYVDLNGNLMFDYSDTSTIYFSDVYDFTDDRIAHVRNGEGYCEGYIDTNGKPVIDIKYFNIGDFAENGLTYAYKFGEKYGFIDKKGNYVIKPQFDKAEDFDYNGYAKVNMGYEFDTVEGTLAEGKWGLIDENGNYVVQPIYDEIVKIEYYVAVVRSDDKYGFINLKKNITVEPAYREIYLYNDKFIFCVDMQYKNVYMDLDGNIDKNVENSINVGKHYSYYIGYIDSEGNAQIDKQLLDSNIFVNGVNTFYCNGEYGIIDSNGNIDYIEDAYYLGEFSANGLVSFCIHDNKKIGFADKSGNYVVEPQYERVTNFYDDNYAVVVKNGEYEILNEHGQNIFNMKFEDVNVKKEDWIWWN